MYVKRHHFITILSSIFSVINGRCTPEPGTTPYIRDVVTGRCALYQQVVNSDQFCRNGLSTKRNCTEVSETFIKSFSDKPQCNVSLGSFDDFLQQTQHDIKPNKSLFWSDVYDIVHKYSQGGARMETLEDTMTGYLIDRLRFCGQSGSPGLINGRSCPGFTETSTCPWNAEFSFWASASMHFAQKARGEATVMLNASLSPAYSPDSFFGKWEVPNMDSTKMSKLNIWLIAVPGQEIKEGESCNHIAALLYALVDISTKKKDGLQSSTSTTCKWIQPRKRNLSPQKSQDLVFKKHKFEPSCRTQTVSKKRQNNTSNILPMDASSLCQKLKQCAPHAAILLCDTSSLNEIEITPDVPVPVLHKINFMYGDNVNLMNKECTTYFEDYFYSLKCSEDDCRIIEENTKRQSKSYQWKVARAGRLTSSNFGTIFKLKDTTPPDNTLKTLLNYTEFQAASVRWGSSHEAAARRVYTKSIQKIHPPMKIMQCGLIINPLYPHLGSSPDALIHCTHCEQNDGVLEIKCPYKYRFVLPSEAAKDKAFCCELVQNKLQLKKNHAYYFQILGQMAITNRKWCDFFIWTLKGHSVERIHFDNNAWDNLLSKLNTFYKSAVIPELFSQRVKRGLTLFK